MAFIFKYPKKKVVGMAKCSKCGSSYVVNKTFCLCKFCNNERLHGNKYGKQKKREDKESALSDKAQRQIELDEATYKEVFNNSEDYCEECNAKLNSVFRDDNNRVANRSRYAHILPKSVYPDIRNNPLNFFNLCMTCHSNFDHGDKTKMRIYQRFLKFRENYFDFKNKGLPLRKI